MFASTRAFSSDPPSATAPPTPEELEKRVKGAIAVQGIGHVIGSDIASYKTRHQWTGYKTSDTPLPAGLVDSAASLSRTFQLGDTYTANDLDERNAFGHRAREKFRKTQDPFDLLELSPLHQYRAPSLFSTFLTEMGRIRGRRENNLTAKNQRKLTKAIKRARAMGLMSSMQRPKNTALHLHSSAISPR